MPDDVRSMRSIVARAVAANHICDDIFANNVFHPRIAEHLLHAAFITFYSAISEKEIYRVVEYLENPPNEQPNPPMVVAILDNFDPNNPRRLLDVYANLKKVRNKLIAHLSDDEASQLTDGQTYREFYQVPRGASHRIGRSSGNPEGWYICLEFPRISDQDKQDFRMIVSITTDVLFQIHHISDKPQ